MFLFITAKPNDLESRNLSHWIRHSQFTLVLLKTNEKMFLSMIFPLLCFSPDLDTFFCLFTSKKGHSYEKNSDLQFHSILQTTRDSREEKKIFHVVQLKSYFFFVHPLPPPIAALLTPLLRHLHRATSHNQFTTTS